MSTNKNQEPVFEAEVVYKKMMGLISKVNDPDFRIAVEEINNDQDLDNNEIIELIAREFVSKKLHEDESIDEKTRLFFREVYDHYSASPAPQEPAANEGLSSDIESAASEDQLSRASRPMTQPDAREGVNIKNQDGMHAQFYQGPHAQQAAQREDARSIAGERAGGPTTIDLFGSLWTSLGSLFAAKKTALGHATDYLGEQMRTEFGNSGGDNDSIIAKGRLKAVKDMIELAGRRLEDGRDVDLNAVMKHLGLIQGTFDDISSGKIKDVSPEFMDEVKDTVEEFSEKAAKKQTNDQDERKRLDEMVKIAQDIGRTISEIIERIKSRVMGAVGPGAEEGSSSVPARPRV